MRVALVLLLVTRLVNKHMLQPAYIPELAGMRGLLVDIAKNNPAQAASLRSELIPVFGEEQRKNAEGTVTCVLKDLIEGCAIRHLLADDARAPFREALANAIVALRDYWQQTVRFDTRTLEPTFKVDERRPADWTVLLLGVAAGKRAKNKRPVAERKDVQRQAIVVFPQIWSVQQEFRLVVPGVIVSALLVQKASDEARNATANVPSIPLFSSRARRDTMTAGRESFLVEDGGAF